MPYKTILVHTDFAFAADDRVRFAARLALACDAHLVGAALAATAGDARLALQRFAGIVRDTRLASSEACVVDAADGLAPHATHADLAVVGQSDHTQCKPCAPDLPALLAQRSGRPVLAIPFAGWRAPPDRDAVIAWDGSPAAGRAVAAALPLLRLARTVTVLAHDATRAPVDWLARHGVTVRVRATARADGTARAALAGAAANGAGLLVMGADDGAAAVLRAMTIPVLVAH